MSKYPVSAECPQCSGIEFEAHKPEQWISYASDRVCNKCGTRYTPPTPTWAAVAFIVVGLIMVGCSVFAIGAAGLGGIAQVGLIGFVGVMAVRHGLRALKRPGKI